MGRILRSGLPVLPNSLKLEWPDYKIVRKNNDSAKLWTDTNFNRIKEVIKFAWGWGTTNIGENPQRFRVLLCRDHDHLVWLETRNSSIKFQTLRNYLQVRYERFPKLQLHWNSAPISTHVPSLFLSNEYSVKQISKSTTPCIHICTIYYLQIIIERDFTKLRCDLLSRDSIKSNVCLRSRVNQTSLFMYMSSLLKSIGHMNFQEYSNHKTNNTHIDRK